MLIRIDERVNSLCDWRDEVKQEKKDALANIKADQRQKKGLWVTVLTTLLLTVTNIFTGSHFK